MSDRPRIAPLPRAEWSAADEASVAPYERRGRVANVFSTLLRHSRLAEAWFAFGGYTFNKTTLSDRDREILILRTACVAKCDYEWHQHLRIARRLGFSEQDFVDIREGRLSPREQMLVAVADALIRTTAISDPLWAALAEHYDEKQLMDIVFTVGSYLTLAMALNAFQVELDPGLRSHDAA